MAKGLFGLKSEDLHFKIPTQGIPARLDSQGLFEGNLL